MNNVSNKDKLNTSVLVLKEMHDYRDAKIEAGISKSWLSKQRTIQDAIIHDYIAKIDAEKSQ